MMSAFGSKENDDSLRVTKLDLVLKTIMLLTIFIFITLYLLFFDFSWQYSWVVFNLGVGYMILTNGKRRNYYLRFFKGFLEIKVWAYAALNIFLVVGTMVLFFFISSGSTGGGSDGGGGNPFVSNPLFLLFLIPIVPIFADAETRIFQGLIIKKIMGRYLTSCKSCQKKALALEKCDLCGNDTGVSKVRELSHLYLSKVAVFVSAFVFALVHVILTWNVGTFILIVGGYLLGHLYIKEGAVMVAKVHMIYNYILLFILIISMFM